MSSDLAITLAGTQGAAGTLELTLALRNSSTVTCTMNGYPALSLYDKNGPALPSTEVQGGSYNFTDFAPSTVTLAAGAIAYANVGYSDVPTGNTPCSAAAAMWVSPPGGDVNHQVISQAFEVCNGGKLTASPVFGQGSPEVQTTAPPHP